MVWFKKHIWFKRFGFTTFADILERAGETSEELFQGELLWRELINYLSSDEPLWHYSCMPGTVPGSEDTKLRKKHSLRIPPSNGNNSV